MFTIYLLVTQAKKLVQIQQMKKQHPQKIRTDSHYHLLTHTENHLTAKKDTNLSVLLVIIQCFYSAENT